MNLTELLDAAETHARLLALQLKEQVPPTWFLFDGVEVFKTATPWRDEKQRAIAKVFIRHFIRERKITAYGFVSEVWMADYAKEEEEGELKVQPKDRPDRKEGILAFATDGKAVVNRSWEIVRDWNERVIGLELKGSRNYAELGGWMVELLGTPKIL